MIDIKRVVLQHQQVLETVRIYSYDERLAETLSRLLPFSTESLAVSSALTRLIVTSIPITHLLSSAPNTTVALDNIRITNNHLSPELRKQLTQTIGSSKITVVKMLILLASRFCGSYDEVFSNIYTDDMVYDPVYELLNIGYSIYFWYSYRISLIDTYMW